MINELEAALLEALLALTAALLLVLALRVPLRRWLGARVAYGLWYLPLIAMAASALPAPQRAIEVEWLMPMASLGPISTVAIADVAAARYPDWLAWVWIGGTLLLAVILLVRQRRFIGSLHPLLPHGDRSFLSAHVGGPMLVGHWRPFIVLPLDFAQRYTHEQQRLMLDHERAHLGAGDTGAIALAHAVACAAWFNPVVWWALRRFRFDQELACDARVLENRPRARRAYADAMLQTQLAEQRRPAPLGCHWPDGHPLKERIQMLNQALPGPTGRRRGLLLIALLSMLLSLAVWAAQPERAVAAGDRLYAVRLLLTQPGQAPQMPSLIVAEGELAGIRSDDDEVDLKVNPGADGMLYVASRIRVAGKDIGSPTIAVAPGTPGTISIDADTQPAISVTYWVKQHQGAPGSGLDGGSDRLADVRTPPRYPKSALDNRIEGEVVLDLDVDANGVVRDVAVVSATPPGVFDAAAVAAARGWWLNPQNHPPGALPARMRAPVKFELDQETPPAG